MTRENYYLSLYQATLARNLTKVLELHLFTDEEKDNCLDEYPALNYNKIFQDNNPDDIIYDILLSEPYKDFLYAMEKGFEPQATKENIDIREANHLNLMKLPLINYCPYPISPVATILSISHSSVLDKDSVSTSLLEVVDKSLIIKEILSSIATYISIDSVKPFSIFLIGDEMNQYDPATDPNTRGYYFHLYNRLIVTTTHAKLNLGFTVHELAHKAMKAIFANGSKPYNEASSRKKYHNAIKNTLLNVKKFAQQEYGLEIKLDEQSDTWQMGKTLSSILIPQCLKSEAISGVLSLLQEHHLKSNEQVPWRKEQSQLEAALNCLNFELADTLIKAGAIIRPTILHSAVNANNLDILNWFLSNKKNPDINHKNEYGKTALDYAFAPQIIQTLISFGANPYSFNNICSLDATHSGRKRSTITQIKQVNALNNLLSFYNQGYDKNQEDEEFIVSLPQTIAEDAYDSNIIEIYEPLAAYWQEVITPAAQHYQDKFDPSSMCLSINELF